MEPEMAKYKSFIIHLQRSKGRKAQVEDLISKSSFDVEIVDAVDGRLLSDADIDACYSEKPLLHPKYPFGVNAGEIGCFLSHRAAWQKIVDQNLTAGLIFEDDVQIDSATFDLALNAAKEWSADYGFIQFQVRKVSLDNPELGRINDSRLLCPVPSLLRCSAQLVSYSTAVQLLELTERFDRPVDTFLQMYWATGVQPVCIVPSGVTDRTQETGGSTLSLKRSKRAKIVREWRRFIYRRKIIYLSRKQA